MIIPLLAGLTSSTQQRKMDELSTKLQVAEKKVLEAQRATQLAETDAKEKDKELNDTLGRIRLYESVSSSSANQ